MADFTIWHFNMTTKLLIPMHVMSVLLFPFWWTTKTSSYLPTFSLPKLLLVHGKLSAHKIYSKINKVFFCTYQTDLAKHFKFYNLQTKNENIRDTKSYYAHFWCSGSEIRRTRSNIWSDSTMLHEELLIGSHCNNRILNKNEGPCHWLKYWIYFQPTRNNYSFHRDLQGFYAKGILIHACFTCNVKQETVNILSLFRRTSSEGFHD